MNNVDNITRAKAFPYIKKHSLRVGSRANQKQVK